jgi:S-adenosylmethionine:tRNA ribosyltransferase-isomerase
VNVSDFDFELPEALVAQEASERGRSRLLVLRRETGSVEHATFADLERFLRPGDLLVLNDTRVFPARLLGHRDPSGGDVECLLMGRPRLVDGAEPGAEEWDALVHPGQKLKPGARMRFDGDGVSLHGEILARRFQGRRTVRLWTNDPGGVGAVVDRIGHIPLPPYIKRDDRPADRERYQTVYAAERGSIAAPTAGLHFTPGQLASLHAAGIEEARVTLHVGYGTFKPVRVERVEDHEVDPESYNVTPAAAEALTRARREGRRIVAVGTTTVRVLESLHISASGEVGPGTGETRLFIHPGHEFRLVDALVTNFHLPKSSLLMLVAAFAGRDRVLNAYRQAVAGGYRFYSYGDAMLVV